MDKKSPFLDFCEQTLGVEITSTFRPFDCASIINNELKHKITNTKLRAPILLFTLSRPPGDSKMPKSTL